MALELPELRSKLLIESLESGAFRAKVRSDFMGGLKRGVNGTPAFFINGKRHDTAFELDDLIAAIDAEVVKHKAPT
jgi:protein-disulfide isomerase